jgi:hypothetical protein
MLVEGDVGEHCDGVGDVAVSVSVDARVHPGVAGETESVRGIAGAVVDWDLFSVGFQ